MFDYTIQVIFSTYTMPFRRTVVLPFLHLERLRLQLIPVVVPRTKSYNIQLEYLRNLWEESMNVNSNEI